VKKELVATKGCSFPQISLLGASTLQVAQQPSNFSILKTQEVCVHLVLGKHYLPYLLAYSMECCLPHKDIIHWSLYYSLLLLHYNLKIHDHKFLSKNHFYKHFVVKLILLLIFQQYSYRILNGLLYYLHI
jgi:hypothetical protein